MIKTLLGNITGNLGTYIIGAAVVAIGVYIWMQDAQISSLKEDLETANQQVSALNTKVQTQDQTISTMERQYLETVEGTQQLNSEVAQLREDQNEIEAQYNEYRGRLAKLSAKKPGLVERLANNAFSDLMQSFAEATSRSNNQSDEQSDSDTGTSGKAN
ncbi:MAG: hypothetical protein CMP47_12395 [Rickettsiales bacterium]|nr:hypothetical protein [Rickettsiales bacterium]|tara:strand:+ start:5543 stop:6019 length:477 start_codon:yes stop_codon:yes gene_type:complete